MSQGDYIHLKKLKRRLSKQNDLAPILDSQDYTQFAAFCAESSISNDLPVLSRLDLSNQKRILDVPVCSVLPSFPMTQTNERENRVLNPFSRCVSAARPPTLKHSVSRPLTQKEKDAWQCRVGCPQRTTSNFVTLKIDYDTRHLPKGTHVYALVTLDRTKIENSYGQPYAPLPSWITKIVLYVTTGGETVRYHHFEGVFIILNGDSVQFDQTNILSQFYGFVFTDNMHNSYDFGDYNYGVGNLSMFIGLLSAVVDVSSISLYHSSIAKNIIKWSGDNRIRKPFADGWLYRRRLS
jgi:hypothetical protein